MICFLLLYITCSLNTIAFAVDVYISLNSSCKQNDFLCEGSRENPYPSFIFGLIASQNKAAESDSVNIILLDTFYVISETQLSQIKSNSSYSAFVKIFRNTSIIPLVCLSETGKQACINQTYPTTVIALKTENLTISVQATLSITGIFFQGSDLHLDLNQSKYAPCRDSFTIFCCDFSTLPNSKPKLDCDLTNKLLDRNSDVVFSSFFELNETSSVNILSLTFDSCRFAYFHSIRRGSGFRSLINVKKDDPFNLLVRNTSFLFNYFYEGILTTKKYQETNLSWIRADLLARSIEISGSSFVFYNYFNITEKNTTLVGNGLFNLYRPIGFQIVASSFINCLNIINVKELGSYIFKEITFRMTNTTKLFAPYFFKSNQSFTKVIVIDSDFSSTPHITVQLFSFLATRSSLSVSDSCISNFSYPSTKGFFLNMLSNNSVLFKNLLVQNLSAVNTLSLVIYLESFNSLVFSNVSFLNAKANISESKGVSFYLISNNDLKIEKCVFRGFYSNTRGGLISITDNNTVKVSQTLFWNVTAKVQGGIFYASILNKIDLDHLVVWYCKSGTGTLLYIEFNTTVVFNEIFLFNSNSGIDANVLYGIEFNFIILNNLFITDSVSATVKASHIHVCFTSTLKMTKVYSVNKLPDSYSFFIALDEFVELGVFDCLTINFAAKFSKSSVVQLGQSNMANISFFYVFYYENLLTYGGAIMGYRDNEIILNDVVFMYIVSLGGTALYLSDNNKATMNRVILDSHGVVMDQPQMRAMIFLEFNNIVVINEVTFSNNQIKLPLSKVNFSVAILSSGIENLISFNKCVIKNIYMSRTSLLNNFYRGAAIYGFDSNLVEFKNSHFYNLTSNGTEINLYFYIKNKIILNNITIDRFLSFGNTLRLVNYFYDSNIICVKDSYFLNGFSYRKLFYFNINNIIAFTNTHFENLSSFYEDGLCLFFNSFNVIHVHKFSAYNIIGDDGGVLYFNISNLGVFRELKCKQTRGKNGSVSFANSANALYFENLEFESYFPNSSTDNSGPFIFVTENMIMFKRYFIKNSAFTYNSIVYLNSKNIIWLKDITLVNIDCYRHLYCRITNIVVLEQLTGTLVSQTIFSFNQGSVGLLRDLILFNCSIGSLARFDFTNSVCIKNSTFKFISSSLILNINVDNSVAIFGIRIEYMMSNFYLNQDNKFFIRNFELTKINSTAAGAILYSLSGNLLVLSEGKVAFLESLVRGSFFIINNNTADISSISFMNLKVSDSAIIFAEAQNSLVLRTIKCLNITSTTPSALIQIQNENQLVATGLIVKKLKIEKETNEKGVLVHSQSDNLIEMINSGFSHICDFKNTNAHITLFYAMQSTIRLTGLNIKEAPGLIFYFYICKAELNRIKIKTIKSYVLLSEESTVTLKSSEFIFTLDRNIFKKIERINLGRSLFMIDHSSFDLSNSTIFGAQDTQGTIITIYANSSALLTNNQFYLCEAWNSSAIIRFMQYYTVGSALEDIKSKAWFFKNLFYLTKAPTGSIFSNSNPQFMLNNLQVYDLIFDSNIFKRNSGLKGALFYYNLRDTGSSTTIENNIFMSNRAVSLLKDEPGKGGVFYFFDKQDEASNPSLKIAFNRFDSNFADIGGVYFCEVQDPISKEDLNLFHDTNKALYYGSIKAGLVTNISLNYAMNFKLAKMKKREIYNFKNLKSGETQEDCLVYIYPYEKFGQIAYKNDEIYLKSNDIITKGSSGSDWPFDFVTNGSLQKMSHTGYFCLKGTFFAEQIPLERSGLTFDIPVSKGINNENISITISFRSCDYGEFIYLTSDGIYYCEKCIKDQHSFKKISDSLESPCKPCSELTPMNCYGGNDLTPKPGFWRKSENSLRFLSCIRKEVCLGDYRDVLSSEYYSIFSTGICEKGYKGILCSECVEGWAEVWGRRCIQCGNDKYIYLELLSIIFHIAFLIIFTHSFFKFAQSNKDNDQWLRRITVLKIYCRHMQFIYQISETPMELNEDHENLNHILLSFTPEIWRSSYFNCLFNKGKPPIPQISLTIFAFCSYLFVIYFIVVLVQFFSRKVTVRQLFKNQKARNYVLAFLILSFPNLLSLALGFLNCVDIGDIGDLELVLESDFTINCWSSPNYFYVLVAGIVVIAILLNAVYVLFKGLRYWRTEMDHQGKDSWFKYYIAPYEEQYYYWDLFDLLCWTFIICINILSYSLDDSLKRILIHLISTATMFFIQKLFKPYKFNLGMNKLQENSLVCAFLSYIACICILNEESVTLIGENLFKLFGYERNASPIELKKYLSIFLSCVNYLFFVNTVFIFCNSPKASNRKKRLRIKTKTVIKFPRETGTFKKDPFTKNPRTLNISTREYQIDICEDNNKEFPLFQWNDPEIVRILQIHSNMARQFREKLWFKKKINYPSCNITYSDAKLDYLSDYGARELIYRNIIESFHFSIHMRFSVHQKCWESVISSFVEIFLLFDKLNENYYTSVESFQIFENEDYGMVFQINSFNNEGANLAGETLLSEYVPLCKINLIPTRFPPAPLKFIVKARVSPNETQEQGFSLRLRLIDFLYFHTKIPATDTSLDYLKSVRNIASNKEEGSFGIEEGLIFSHFFEGEINRIELEKLKYLKKLTNDAFYAEFTQIFGSHEFIRRLSFVLFIQGQKFELLIIRPLSQTKVSRKEISDLNLFKNAHQDYLRQLTNELEAMFTSL